MLKLTVLMHMLLGTVLAGIFMVVVLAVPSLADQGMKLLPIAALVGVVVAIPFSIWIAKAILAQTKGV